MTGGTSRMLGAVPYRILGTNAINYYFEECKKLHQFLKNSPYYQETALNTSYVTFFKHGNKTRTSEPVSWDLIEQRPSNATLVCSWNIMEKTFDITAADARKLNQLFWSNVVSYNASDKVVVVFTRAMTRFQASLELLKRAGSKRISLSTFVLHERVPSSSASLYLIHADDDISNDIFTCWESFILESCHFSNASWSLPSESMTTNATEKKPLALVWRALMTFISVGVQAHLIP